MDSHNLFFTRFTARALRAEYLAALAFSIVVAVVHLRDIRWPVFLGMFLYIDLIGYLPGAIAYRRARRGTGDGRIPRVYYVLYNSMHSLLSAAAVAGLWCLFARPEWALLALPIHLCGDRALFGNFLKPFGLSFEPAVHPAYQEFVSRYDQDADPSVDVPGAPGARVAALV